MYLIAIKAGEFTYLAPLLVSWYNITDENFGN